VDTQAGRIYSSPGLAVEGFLPNGFYKNRDFYGTQVETEIKGFLSNLIFDPQSSGGLLIALSEADADHFKNDASRVSLDYWVIGRFVAEHKGKIRVK